MRERITVMSSMENDQFMAAIPEITEKQRIRDRLSMDMARFFESGGQTKKLPPMTCKEDQAADQRHQLRNPELRKAPDRSVTRSPRKGVVESGSRTEMILNLLPMGHSMTYEQIQRATEMPYRRLSEYLKRIHRQGKIDKSGEGRSSVWTRIA